ncbi:MAG TPA: hypothetical protein VM692_16990 [Gammaproteobacteria bacterium]|nr:hypothetical protein [Gammaproteobacteria bacterium]
MVRAVLVAPRHQGQPNRLDLYCDVLNRKLAGSNIEPRPPLFARRAGLSAAMLNPNGAARMHGASIAVGALLGAGADWHVPRAPLPDGSFALLRGDESYVELVADSTASRTLWYALTDDELIVSSSQRAIVTLLGSFEPNRAALPWMLSSGTLGPTGGWDARLRRVQPGERVLLDRARWRLRSTVDAPSFVADRSLSRAEHLARLQTSVAAACDAWSFDAKKWVLTLSGGADSRSLLCMLRDRGLATVTWGLSHTGEQAGNDALIAREVARALAVPHRFLAIDAPGDPPDVVLDRFLAVGEGRVDRISGYVDGFCVWKTLFDEGYEGVVRGDEAFGWVPAHTSYAVRSATNLTTLADFFPANELETFELPTQRLPDSLLRGSDETLATWRDRLYQQSRVPTFLAALTDLKTAYLEVGTPLLARSVLDCVRAMPDELRTRKRLWMELVSAQLPQVPFARRVAIPSVTDFLTDSRVLTLLLDELKSERAAELFAAPLRTRLCTGLATPRNNAQAAKRDRWRDSALARVLPAPLKAAVRNWRANRPSIEPLVLAFRALVAARMHGVLAADAATPAPETTVDTLRARYRAV